MRIELLVEAEADLMSGANFYDLQQPSLGDYFTDSLLSDIESLHIHAGVHPIQFNFHRMLSKRFPFAIYYRIEQEVVRVYAVLDCRRSPERASQLLYELDDKEL